MTNSTITTIKFHATTTQVQDVVIWMDDVEESVKEMGTEETIQAILDKVLIGEWKNLGTIHVVDEQKEIAQAFAAVLNTKYEMEMELMNQANVARKEVKKAAVGTESTKALRSAAGTKKFLKEQAAKLANAKQSPLKNKSEEETTMTTETTKEATSIRRKKAVTKTKGETTVKETVKETAAAKKETAVKEKAAVIKEKHAAKKEKEAAPKSRRSSTVTKEVATQSEKKNAGKMGRDEPQTGGGYQAFEGPWYLNASRYEVLHRLADIVVDKADAELGITDITVSNREDVKMYKNRQDVLFVIQFKANGNVLTFPITAASESSKADLKTLSMDWKEIDGKRYPVFGFSRPNTIMVDFTCSCGKKNRANTGNMYCFGCRKTWADIDVTVDKEYGFEYDIVGSKTWDGKDKDGTPWIFQEIPNVKVPTETIVLALAIAQFDEDLDMWDVPGFEEDAE